MNDINNNHFDCRREEESDNKKKKMMNCGAHTGSSSSYNMCLNFMILYMSFRMVMSGGGGGGGTIHMDQEHGNFTNLTVIEKPFPPPNYDGRESGVHGRPQEITLTVWVESIVNIDVSAMEYVVHGYIIQEWNDARLNGSLNHPILLSKEDGKAVWLPDLYCLSCRSSTLNQITNPNVLIKIFPNGDIYYSQLAKLVGSCFMNLHNFPFDNQICPMNFSSYGYDTTLMALHWKSTPIVEKMQLEQFIVNENVVPHSLVKRYPSGNYTILSFELFFTRQMGFYMLQVYIPSIVLVSLSWMTFFMEPTDVGDRLSIGVTLILTMIFLLGYINQSLPKVSYIKAIDWYVIASLFMIVTSVIESVLVYWLLHKKQNEEKMKKETALEKFLDRKFSLDATTYNLLPLFNPAGNNNNSKINGQQASDISIMSNLTSSKPFYPTMKTLCEEQNQPKENNNIINHENNGTTHTNRNGTALYNRNSKPIFARFENNESSVIAADTLNSKNESNSLTTVDENEETRFINNNKNNQNHIKNNNNNNKKNTQPFVRNRGNNNNSNKFRNHRNSLHASRHTNQPGTGAVENKNALRDTDGEDEDEDDMLQNLDKIYKLDIFARTVLPLFYVIFTVAYFVFYSGTKW